SSRRHTIFSRDWSSDVCSSDLMKENDKFPQPIITPATKAEMGDHDEDISREDILKRGIVSEADYLVLEDYTRKLFQRGTEIAARSEERRVGTESRSRDMWDDIL